MQYFLIVTRSSMIPRQKQNSLIIERTDLSATHGEADIVIVQQVCQFTLDVGIKSVCLFATTQMLLCFLHIFIKNWAYKPIFSYKQPVVSGVDIVDITLTAKTNKKIILNILAVHPTSGSNTIATYHGVGKASIIKNIRMVKQVNLSSNTEAYIDEVVNETATFIGSCYGFETNNMSDCRINS